MAAALPGAARAAVVALKKEGAEFIKILSELSREAYFAIVDEARKQGILFAGHVPGSVSHRQRAPRPW